VLKLLWYGKCCGDVVDAAVTWDVVDALVQVEAGGGMVCSVLVSWTLLNIRCCSSVVEAVSICWMGGKM
jgi:hypothetical protein